MKNKAFQAIYSMNSPILITGHTGFKGTWLMLLLNALEIPFIGLSLEPEIDSLHCRANLAGSCPEAYLDIRDEKKVRNFIAEYQPGAVIHLAAQPLVLKSYKQPKETFETNVMGTINVLNASFETKSVKSFIGITTDKVYKNNNSGRRFVEIDPLEGKDPYSASKVGMENALAAWRQISKIDSGPNVLSMRAGNVIGGGDFAENRIIPDLVRAISSGNKLEIRNPNSTRPWQHVLDPLFGYLLALEYSLISEAGFSPIFNFGPEDDSRKVTDVVLCFKRIFQERLDVLECNDNNDNLESINLDLDSSYARGVLNWTPCWNQIDSINLTAMWWKNVLFKNQSALEACTKDISRFLEKKFVN